MKPFPLKKFPNTVKRYLEECSEALQVDPAGLALSTLVGCASQIGNSTVLVIKNTDKRPCVLNGGIVGDTGIRKTAMVAQPLKPINQLQETLFNIHDVHLDEWKAACRDAKRGNEPYPEEPVPEQLICSDVTLEALGPLLKNNPRGLLLQVDELAGHFGGMNQYHGGKGKDEAAWLSIYDAGPITVNRKGSKQPIYVPRAAVSIIGSIQPAVFREIFSGKMTDNGMASRYLWYSPEKRQTGWTDATVSAKSLGDMQDMFDRLRTDFPVVRGEDPIPLYFNDESMEMWKDYVNSHGQHLYKLSGVEAGLFSKCEGHCSRIAAIFHQVRYALNETEDFGVDEIDLSAGIALAEYYFEHARSLLVTPNRLLCEIIAANGGRITPREFAKKTRYRKSDDAERKLLELERLDIPLLERKYAEIHSKGPGVVTWKLTVEGWGMAGNLRQVTPNTEKNEVLAENVTCSHEAIESLEAPF